MLGLSQEYQELHEELMNELSKNAIFQKNCSSTEVTMANEQMNYCPTATATAANTPPGYQEQAFTASTATAASQSDTTAQDRQEKFKLLAALSIPILIEPARLRNERKSSPSTD